MDGASSWIGDSDKQSGLVVLTVPQEYGKSAQIRFANMSALGGSTLMLGTGTRMHHTRKFDHSIEKPSVAKHAEEQVTGAVREYEAFVKQVRRLVRHEVPKRQARTIIGHYFRKAPAKAVLTLYGTEALGIGLKGRQGTAWGLFNAIAEYVDHHQGYRHTVRLRRSLLGVGDALKRRAFAELLRAST